MTAPAGSTKPLASPAAKLLPRPAPACRMGRLMAAPSGIFCSPMPILSAAAPAIASPWPVAAKAAAKPITMPSGRLCRVTASTTRPLCPWPPANKPPAARSSKSRPTAPATKPRQGASQLLPPCPALSMAGMSRLHTLAASITPAANPSMALCAAGRGCRFKKNTTAAPSAVHAQGNAVVSSANHISCIHIYPLFWLYPHFMARGGRGCIKLFCKAWWGATQNRQKSAPAPAYRSLCGGAFQALCAHSSRFRYTMSFSCTPPSTIGWS